MNELLAILARHPNWTAKVRVGTTEQHLVEIWADGNQDGVSFNRELALRVLTGDNQAKCDLHALLIHLERTLVEAEKEIA